MARYGYNYNTGQSLDGFFASLRIGLEEALEPTAVELLEIIQDIIRQDIYYTYYPKLYDRTYEIYASPYYEIVGTTIYFMFGGIHTIDTIHHHYLEQGYTEMEMIDEISQNKWHNNQVMEDIRDSLKQNFMRIYQRHCKELGIKLE